MAIEVVHTGVQDRVRGERNTVDVEPRRTGIDITRAYGTDRRAGQHTDTTLGPKAPLADGSTSSVEGRFVGTHTGPLASDDGDAEPSGAVVDLRVADVSRVSDGKIVAYHTYYDQFGLLTQLGLVGDWT